MTSNDPSDPAEHPHSGEEPRRRSVWMRAWIAAPDSAFRWFGAVFFFVFVGLRARKYVTEPFETLGPHYLDPNGISISMWWVPMLVDLTFLLIALSFVVRLPPRTRASDGRVIAFSLFVAFMPLLPLWVGPLLGLFDPAAEQAWLEVLWRQDMALWELVLGGVLITLGNALDVWGYATLWRSFGIVPEARELKTTGPYRFVRHPVYLGQFIAQAGVWWFFADRPWIAFWVAFVVLQLLRSKLEDDALAAAFGAPYRDWQARTFWFV